MHLKGANDLMIATQFRNKRFERILPENIEDCDAVHFHEILSYDCPGLSIYEFDSINILPDGTLFKGIVPMNLSFPFFRKRLKHHNKKGIIRIRLKWKKRKLSTNGPYVVIHDPWTINYYHWITQALPRLLLVLQQKKPFTLLLPEDHQSEFHLASLKLLQIDTWHVMEGKGEYYCVKNLWYPTHDIQIGDYNDDLINLLRFKLSKPILRDTNLKRLFIHRASKKKRYIVNERDVIQVFLNWGFEIIDFERLSFMEQISQVNCANVLAGVHGAGLTNMMFLQARSSVFELTTKVNGENYYYYSLSNSLYHKYYYQMCDSDHEAVVQEANLIVDINKLEKNIALILSDDKD